MEHIGLKSLSRKLVAPALAAMTMAAVLVPAQAGEPVRWRVPVAFGTHLPALGDNINYVAETLDASTAGEVQFKVFEPGKLVAPLSITEAVKDGKMQAGYTWLGYDQGRIPSAPLLAARPFGMEPWEYTAWWYEGGGMALGEAVYAEHGVHPILCGIIGPETAGWFRNKITSLDDIDGLKIRFAGLGGKVLQKLGASVTVLPGGEIFPALEKGAIDATEFSMPAIDQLLGFDKIIKNNYFPGWHQTYTAFHLVVNSDTWAGLPDDRKALLNMACAAGVTRNLAKGEAIQGAVIAGFEEKGVTANTLPEALLRELQAITAEVMEEEAANDAHFKAIYESQEAFSADYKNWKSLAYLPRDF
ncbi:TRAP transporter substrate-binding protein [Maritalea mediterranea]|uniref:TRAP transporter substrate-binding protein n=1 Tax=Maritalea mediterranea TaxID=2909667 RepID=A0ABS9E8V0_9HYPH|nr:TRAP transporter substrate-binding protein [Maritalea mediterranea]MCF4099297.1 TRAP transporter substrate-binding protein [Maritalea mediterranea]